MAQQLDDTGFCMVTEEEIGRVRTAFESFGVKGVEKFIESDFNEWKNKPMAMALVGNVGVGKSSLCNALRGLTAEDEGAARVNVVEETKEAAEYSHPNNVLLKFWDLPGAGSPDFPIDTYLDTIKVDHFDFFLIICKDAFTENDMWLAEEIAKRGKKFFFIRTQIHTNIQNDMHDYQKKWRDGHRNIEYVLEQIRSNIQENLGQALYNSENVFLIDSHEQTIYDFSKLQIRLVDEFPKLKQDALILSLVALSEEMIRKKVELLQGKIWRSAAISGVVGAVPVPGVSLVFDIGLIYSMVKEYQKQLGLDEESLERTARLTGCRVERLQEVVRSSDQFCTKQQIKVVCTSAASLAQVAEEFIRTLPLAFLSALITVPLSFAATFGALKFILDKLEEVALLVVRAAIEDSTALQGAAAIQEDTAALQDAAAVQDTAALQDATVVQDTAALQDERN